MKTISKIGGLALVLLMFFGCGTSSYVVSDRPSEPVYVRPMTPGPGYVWIDGGWRYRGGKYVYRPGYWTAPRPHYNWRPGYWDRRGNGWYYRRGGWNRHR